MKYIAATLFVLLPFGVQAAEQAATPAAAYRAVIQAQQAAKAPATPISAEEARRIHENYLQSVGKKTAERIPPSGGNAGNQPR